MKKRKLTMVGIVLFSAVLILNMFSSVFAESIHEQEVHVIVENTTYKKTDGAPWDGTLVDTWVDIDTDKGSSDDSMMTCIKRAVEDAGYHQEGADSGYISEINGLGEFGNGPQSGWMGSLNDWFVNEGFDAFTVKKGTLEAGDEIRVMYTSNGLGEDIGSSWSNCDKTLKTLSVSSGKLSPAFDPNVHQYQLTLTSNVKEVCVVPEAANKSYQVHTAVNGTEYKRNEAIPVQNGTVITVKDGDPSWPSMSENSGEAQVYTISVKIEDTGLLMGDANNDGRITIDDVNAIQLQLAKLGSLSEKGKLQADVNGDSKVTIDDGNRIQLYLAKIIREL